MRHRGRACYAAGQSGCKLGLSYAHMQSLEKSAGRGELISLGEEAYGVGFQVSRPTEDTVGKEARKKRSF